MREVNEARLALADINNSPYCGSAKGVSICHLL
jgi:hypothetical protein